MLEEVFVEAADVLLVEVLADEIVSGLGHLSSEFGIVCHFIEGLGEGNFVVHRDEEPADAVLDYFIGTVGTAGGNRGSTAGEGFDEDVWQSFPAAAEGEAVGGLIEGKGIFLESQPADLGLNPESFGQSFEFGFEFSLSEHPELGIRSLQPSEGAKE